MCLSRLLLSARSRAARAWLADCHALHRAVMSGFPAVGSEAARAALGILYRVEPMTEPPSIPVLVQSKHEPHWMLETDAITKIEKPKSLDGLLSGIQNGGRYRFRLLANPVRRVHRRATLDLDSQSTRQRVENAGAVGKRVELTREADQVAWLERRAEAGGFAVLTVRPFPADRDIPSLLAAGATKMDGRRDGGKLTFGNVLFEGTLGVIDAGHFRNAVATGIGPGKAFGCGLLSIAQMLNRTG